MDADLSSVDARFVTLAACRPDRRGDKLDAMNVLLTFDKFKGALTASQACSAAADALSRVQPGWRLRSVPLTDGGEGFVEILTYAVGGKLITRRVKGSRGETVSAALGLVPAEIVPMAVRAVLAKCRGLMLEPRDVLAVIEMAAVCGLAGLPAERRDPWQAGTNGVGEMLNAAAGLGATAILIGVGGSATIDLGLGALAEIGIEFFDKNARVVRQPVPAVWPDIASIRGPIPRGFPPIFVACDVRNPLLGPDGAAAVYGPQKGLAPSEVPAFDRMASRMAILLCNACARPMTMAWEPGAGAAGGIACGLRVAADACLISGFDLVAAWLELEAQVAAADLVLTGEGRFDATSLAGKGPGAVVRLAEARGIPVHVFAGGLDSPGSRHRHGINPPDESVAQSLLRARELLEAAVAAVFAPQCAEGGGWCP